MALEIIPLVQLLKKNIIINERALKLNDALELIKKLEFTRIYALDIKGLLKGKPSFEAIKKIGAAKSLWLESSARTCEDCIDLIIAGAENVVINPAIVPLKNLEYCAKVTRNIIIKLEFNEENEVITSEKRKLHDIIEIAKNAQIENLITAQKNLTRNVIDVFANNNLRSYILCTKSELAKFSDWKLSGAVIPLEEVAKI
ncbi:MAG: hypothetical protein QMD21_06240 [Candidatus Thermoplasmatota archaeon]|nr:hypothetical protein [Candidatus Thermoplasmatota archaeon]